MTYEQHPDDKHMEVGSYWSYCYNGQTGKWMGNPNVGDNYNGVYHSYNVTREPVSVHTLKCAIYADKYVRGLGDYGFLRDGHYYHRTERIGEHSGVSHKDGCTDCKRNQPIR